MVRAAALSFHQFMREKGEAKTSYDLLSCFHAFLDTKLTNSVPAKSFAFVVHCFRM